MLLGADIGEHGAGVGLNGIFATQGDISTLSGLCRIALWYGVNATRPEAIGVGLPGQTA